MHQTLGGAFPTRRCRVPERSRKGCLKTLPISKAKDRLNELVDEASSTHEHVTITKNGSPAAVLIGADEWESLQETLFWTNAARRW